MLKGKVALITGASRGIGRSIALAMAREGADIIVNYAQHTGNADEVVKKIKKLNRNAVAIKADVSNFNEVKSMMEPGCIVNCNFGTCYRS